MKNNLELAELCLSKFKKLTDSQKELAEIYIKILLREGIRDIKKIVISTDKFLRKGKK